MHIYLGRHFLGIRWFLLNFLSKNRIKYYHST